MSPTPDTATQPPAPAIGTDPRRLLGAWGEDQAAQWYERAGYTVLDRNWRTRHGELDLVLQHKSTVVFCEVKTRRSTRFGHPAEAVTAKKQQRIRQLASAWLQANAVRTRQLRFDVVSIVGTDLQVMEGAF